MTLQQEPDGATYFTYTPFNLMESIHHKDDTWTRCWYDGQLRRYALEDPTNGLRYFTWDQNGLNLLTEQSPDGTLVRRYTHGYTSIEDIGSLTRAEEPSTGDHASPFMDHRGTVLGVVDDEGTVTDYSYSSFGYGLGSLVGGPAVTDRWRYQTNWLQLQDGMSLSPTRTYSRVAGQFQQRDPLFVAPAMVRQDVLEEAIATLERNRILPGIPDFNRRSPGGGRRQYLETGLYYFKNRYYDSAHGRFISRDPLGYVDGMNLYAGYFAQMLVADNLGLGVPADHHVAVQAIWNAGVNPMGFSGEARDFFDGATVFDPNHGYTTPHREYNKSVREFAEKWLKDNKCTASSLSADEAERMVKDLLESDSPGIKKFLDEIRSRTGGTLTAGAKSSGRFRKLLNNIPGAGFLKKVPVIKTIFVGTVVYATATSGPKAGATEAYNLTPLKDAQDIATTAAVTVDLLQEGKKAIPVAWEMGQEAVTRKRYQGLEDLMNED